MAGRLSDFLRVARGEIGFVEGPNNDNKYAKIAGHANHYAWCVTFVEAVAKLAGVKLPVNTAYSPTLANAFSKIKKYGKTPKPGAIGFLYFASKGRIAHCFIVEAVNADGTYVTIEGNTDSAGGRSGGRVMRHRRSTANITFGYLDFAPEPKPASKPAAAKPKKPGFIRQLRVGTPQNHAAFLWQSRMLERGWKIAKDGVYGKKSAAIAEAFAKEKGIHFTRDKNGYVIVNKGIWDAAWDEKVTR